MKDRANERQGPPLRHGGLRRNSRLGAARALGTLLVGSVLLGGCSLSVPMGPVADDMATGTIRSAAPSPFSAAMDAEDWRRAKSALATALDPQGNGASVAWDNPKSGARGSFVPLAQVYPKGDGICRPFAAHLTLQGQAETVQHASACRVNSGDWVVGHVTTLTAAAGAPRKSNNLAERDTGTQLR